MRPGEVGGGHAAVDGGGDDGDGHPVRIGAVTDRPDDWLIAIANGYGIALAPESASRYFARPGIVYRPVEGVSPTRVGVAWRPSEDADPVVREFVRSCLEYRETARE
ncbi:LysR substrate-binding domain-containing protein [Nocardia seriolae]|uniref:LysR substrate-binding domain-containing protein n=1 Tax=Nocardia seriolae TaxID=37332 RepID=UPI001D16CA38|nr:LysR substrate-binding domain-containing protein [Nocardia seriolae]WKY56439.1 LysR substrate-binding domain-containing protein [Nocardia seriolae]WNJ63172.1 LysR substrate-binding domain-containing protein [Nocardia seriolae]